VKRYILLIGFILLVPLASWGAQQGNGATEESPKVTYGSEVDFNSQYVWRGIAYSDGAVMQPSVWVSAFDLTFSVWGNFVLNKEANQGEFNEVDLILSYTREWENITVEPTLQFYLYPNQEEAPATGELSLMLSYPVGFIRLFTDQTLDIIRYGGSYFGEAGLSYEHEFRSNLLLEASVHLGWSSSKFNEVYLELPKAAFSVAEGGLSLTYSLKGSLYFRPHIGITTLVDGDLRDQVDNPTLLVGGLAVGLEF